MNLDRKEISDLIFKKLEAHKSDLKNQFSANSSKIGFFYLDNFFPTEFATYIFTEFPKLTETSKRKNLRESKHIAAQMDKYNRVLEDVIYAFQDKKIVALLGDICGIKTIFGDDSLYAAGLSLMEKDNFLNPHLDNSHDKDRKHWRVLNLLYYVTPDWKLEYGGNLEVWQNGLNQNPTTITSKFNRLAVMATHQNSWHSVSKVTEDKVRCCISNYYFAEKPLLASDSFHVTTFRGRPSEKIKDSLLKLDNFTRSIVRKVFKKGVRENPHQYKK